MHRIKQNYWWKPDDLNVRPKSSKTKQSFQETTPHQNTQCDSLLAHPMQIVIILECGTGNVILKILTSLRKRMVGRKPTKEQNQEALELIEKLKDKLECSTDTELCEKLGMVPQHLTNIKIKGFPNYVTKGFNLLIDLNK